MLMFRRSIFHIQPTSKFTALSKYSQSTLTESIDSMSEGVMIPDRKDSKGAAQVRYKSIHNVTQFMTFVRFDEQIKTSNYRRIQESVSVSMFTVCTAKYNILASE